MINNRLKLDREYLNIISAICSPSFSYSWMSFGITAALGGAVAGLASPPLASDDILRLVTDAVRVDGMASIAACIFLYTLIHA